MRLPADWDWKNPDYTTIFQMRMDALLRLRRGGASALLDLKAYYRESADGIADFINDWGMTFDPRLVERGLPSLIPFVLFDRQREYVSYMVRKWREGRRGLVEKSRDEGVSWLCVGTGAGLCILHDRMSIGFGSRTEPYVDKIGEPKSLFHKGRIFMENLPRELRAGWTLSCAPFMRMNFPETGSHWTGEVGDNIGRGDRTGIYIVDEAAHLERADLIEASLSQTTNCRIDVSSVKGMNNTFAKNRHSGRIEVFVFDWHDDPRKDDEWYRKQCEELDPVVVAQEIDRDYTASVEGIVIPGAWVRAAVDSIKKLGLVRTGAKVAALDVADEGGDLNACGYREGVEVMAAEEWSGKSGDIFGTTERGFLRCDEWGCTNLRYDADGLGAGVRGDARVINERRMGQREALVIVHAFRGSGAVVDPEGQVYPGGGNEGLSRTNKDFFLNCKSQNWWGLRERFRKTWRWVEGGKSCAPDDIISLNSAELGPQVLAKIITELSQPTYTLNGAGKVVIDKTPPGMKSPNLADMVMMLFGRGEAEPVVVTQQMLMQIRAAGAARRRRY